MKYFDTHTHYDWKDFEVDRESLFQRLEKEAARDSKYWN